MATQDEVAKQQEDVAKLRDELVSLRLGEGAANLEEQSNEITLTQLKAEEARLRTEIHELREQNKKRNIQAGAAAPLEAAKEDMKLAVAAQKASGASTAKGSSSSTSGEGR